MFVSPPRRASLSLLLFLSLSPAAVLGAGCSDSHGGDGGVRDSAPADGASDSAPADSARDSGGGLSDCTSPSECIVVPATCCGDCGAAARGDAVAIHIDRLSDHRTAVCPGDMIACPPCYTPSDPTLVATCNAGTCEVVDLVAQPFNECIDGMGCRLRTSSCCECGGDTGPEGLIALPTTAEAAYMSLVCDDGPTSGCPECAPVYPPEASAVCDPAGHCAVAWAGMP